MLNDADLAEITFTQQGLEKAYSNYASIISIFAVKLQKLILNPWLDSMGYSFVTGMGTWVVIDPSKISYDSLGARNWRNYDHQLNDSLPKHISDILEMEVEDTNSELGLWMLDHKQGG